MNAKKFLNVRVCLTATAVALCGALALTASCASDSSSNGGSTGSGGSSGGAGGGSTGSSCSAGADNVCFTDGKASGALAGYGWIALGQDDKITSPTCDTGVPISKAVACSTTTKWSSSDSLCVTGSIPALPAAPVQSDYDNNWGIQIGVNTKEVVGPLGRSFSKITLKVTGSPTANLRAKLHVYGDPDSKSYCANMVSGTSILATAFNTACWDNTGTFLAAADTTNIDNVGVQVSSTASAITVDNLCLTDVQFGN